MKLNSHGWQVRAAIMDHQAFETHGALRAIEGAVWHPGCLGRLPSTWARQYEADGPQIAYTVISWTTPIGWVLRDGTTVVPDVKYSRTTTRHQGLLYVWQLDQESRIAVAEAACRERQKERDRRAERRAVRRDAVSQGYTPGGYYSTERTQWEDLYSAPQGDQSLESSEDPTASLQDRIAALETETFAQLHDTAVLLAKSREALRNA